MNITPSFVPGTGLTSVVSGKGPSQLESLRRFGSTTDTPTAAFDPTRHKSPHSRDDVRVDPGRELRWGVPRSVGCLRVSRRALSRSSELRYVRQTRRFSPLPRPRLAHLSLPLKKEKIPSLDFHNRPSPPPRFHAQGPLLSRGRSTCLVLSGRTTTRGCDSGCREDVRGTSPRDRHPSRPGGDVSLPIGPKPLVHTPNLYRDPGH